MQAITARSIRFGSPGTRRTEAANGRRSAAAELVSDIVSPPRPVAGGFSRSSHPCHGAALSRRGRVAAAPRHGARTTPVLPKPPAARAVSSSRSTSTHSMRSTGDSTPCAMRMPRSIVNGASPAFITITFSSPR